MKIPVHELFLYYAEPVDQDRDMALQRWLHARGYSWIYSGFGPGRSFLLQKGEGDEPITDAVLAEIAKEAAEILGHGDITLEVRIHDGALVQW